MDRFHGIIFGYFPFSESKILMFMENFQNIIREIDFFDFTSFFSVNFRSAGDYMMMKAVA